MSAWTRETVIAKVESARRDGRPADLRGADLSRTALRWADLRGADLSRADLRWADLRGADLSRADLRWADLRRANLSGANLSGANLSGANLRGADLSGANLSGANLRGADLSGTALREADLRWADLLDANLQDADLREADLRATSSSVIVIQGLPSGDVFIVPTPIGWQLSSVGCWGPGTTTDLRALIAGNDWPGARTEEERDRRRPGLSLVADLCDAHAATHPDVVPALADRWGTA